MPRGGRPGGPGPMGPGPMGPGGPQMNPRYPMNRPPMMGPRGMMLVSDIFNFCITNLLFFVASSDGFGYNRKTRVSNNGNSIQSNGLNTIFYHI